MIAPTSNSLWDLDKFSSKKYSFRNFELKLNYIRICHIFGLCSSALKSKFFIWVISSPYEVTSHKPWSTASWTKENPVFRQKYSFFMRLILYFPWNSHLTWSFLSKIQNWVLNLGFRKLRKSKFSTAFPF